MGVSTYFQINVSGTEVRGGGRLERRHGSVPSDGLVPTGDNVPRLAEAGPPTWWDKTLTHTHTHYLHTLWERKTMITHTNYGGITTMSLTCTLSTHTLGEENHDHTHKPSSDN